MFVTQHTQPLSLEQVLLTYVAHSEAAVWTQVAAVEEQSQLRVTPRTYLGEVVSRSEHALHPDCLDLGLELAVHGVRKINIQIKFFCETNVYKMVHMSKRINKMQHNLFLVYIVNFVDFLRWYKTLPNCGVLPIKINNKIKYGMSSKMYSFPLFIPNSRVQWVIALPMNLYDVMSSNHAGAYYKFYL